jgi:O-antigen/teichoic acid export membrane protein
MSLSGRALDRSLVQGIAWLGGMKWATQLASWAVTVMVARLLSPGDYGLFGMAMVYVSLIQLAGEAGVLAAIVQTPKLDELFVARLGGFAVMLGIALTSASIGVASLIAWFYQEEAVRGLIIALSATFVLRGFQLLPRSILIRDLKFRQVAWIDTSETLTLALSTLGYAMLGFRAWALVGGVVTGCCVSTLLYLLRRPHRLAIPRTFADLSDSVKLGLHVIGGQLAWFVYSNSDFVVVGRMLGRSALGAYTFAWTLANLAVDRVSNLVVRVVPPVFSAVRNDPVALRRYVCMLTEGLAFATVPACIGLAMIADVLVETILGPRWHGVIVPLRLLAVYAAFRCVLSLMPQVLVFTGHAKRHMQFSMTAACVLPLLFLFGARWGTTGVAVIWIVAYPVFMSMTYVRYVLKTLELPANRYLAALWPAASVTAFMVLAIFGLRFGLPPATHAPVRLVLYISVGAFVYISIAMALHGRRLRPLLDLLRAERAVPVVPGSDLLSYATADVPGIPRLMLITYHFPPDPAIGSLRWQKFVQYAAARGWGVDVIMRDPSELSTADSARINDLPPGVRVYGVRNRASWFDRLENPLARVTRGLRVESGPPRASSRARAEIGWPRGLRDLTRAYHSIAEHVRGQRWADDATRAGTAIMQRGVHRAIISSGPPHFAHDAARRVARNAELPFVMDMRDPWSLIQRLPESTASPVQLALASMSERRAIASAGLVVANTNPMLSEMCSTHPAAASRIIAVPNGYDDDAMPEPSKTPSPFIVAYAGTIYLDRDPGPLFRGAARAIELLGVTPAEFSIQFMGDVQQFNGIPVMELARDAGIGAFVQLHPPRSRSDAMAFLASAAMLVQLPQDTDMAIPAKLFEYMRFDAWMLVLAESGSATEQLLRGTDADVVSPQNPAAITDVLVRRFGAYAGGLRGERLTVHERFSRRARAATFFDAVERLAGSATAEQAPPQLEQRRRGVVQPPDLTAVAAGSNG